VHSKYSLKYHQHSPTLVEILMSEEYQNIMIFCEGPIKVAHRKKIKLSFGMHPLLINMDLEESMILRIYIIYTYTPQNIYMRPHKCILQIFTLALCNCKK
jgi:hypothetical protein